MSTRITVQGEHATNPDPVRIHAYLARAGVCSRRAAEELVAAGRVLVNGVAAHTWQVILPQTDIVTLDDATIQDTQDRVYYAFYKPRGIVTTCRQDGETGILDIVDIPERVFPIGRLDKDSTGLIILTSDGRLSNVLMHPRYEHEKEYVVETFGPITDRELAKMAAGIKILGRMTKSTTITRMGSGRFSIVLKEGRNRQIRRMVEAVGHTVKRLHRVRVEHITLGDLEPGEYRPLTSTEYQGLMALVEKVFGPAASATTNSE